MKKSHNIPLISDPYTSSYTVNEGNGWVFYKLTFSASQREALISPSIVNM